MKKAIALGGGGARGLAHIGVLKIFEKHGIDFDMIAGTSMGSVIGAMYAMGEKPEEIEKKLKNYLFRVMFSDSNVEKMKGDSNVESARHLIRKLKEFVRYGSKDDNKNSFIKDSLLKEMIDFLIPDIDISETKLPFACVATDITNGKEKIFTKGSLRDIVLASASIPGVFPPVNIDNVWYTDGAHVNVTPVSAARLLGADYVIASDVKSKLKVMDSLPSNSRDIMNRCNFIANYLYYEVLIKEADFVIEPNVKQISWSEFNKFNQMVLEGAKETVMHIDEIKKKMAAFDNLFFRCKKAVGKMFGKNSMKAAVL